MAKKCRGITHIKGKTYLFDLQVNGIRKQVRGEADSLKEARHVRDEMRVELRKQVSMPQGVQERLNAPFEEVREKLFADLLSDKLSHSNMLRHEIIFRRLFGDFRTLRFPHIKSVSQVTLPFFLEYKAYFVNDLRHSPTGGWRSELTCVKSMMRRFRKLGYCSKEIIEDLAEIKRPPHNKKDYPDISNSKLKELLDFIKRDRPDYYPLIYFISRTGRRIKETTLIERKDINWLGLNPIRINIRAETTKARVKAPIETFDEGLKDAVKQAYNLGSRHKTIYLFCNRLGNKCSKNSVRTYLKEVSSKILGVKITPHYFRHRFLTICGKENAPIVDIMNIAGIKDIKVVIGYYSHTTKEGQNKVLAATMVV
ncbi:MAG: site-specific integrase [Candidatus Gorgyraea atricola]|nr:site-specific integrase [Candidatus Gorgyraea atricola]